ncbi:hypothetical protein GCM10009119_02160 [Algoriphagus jejuensis]|uniref:FIST domain-containing protein n=1 Tax=Algoriphagus jejuensis TaxID=419934 RepID=A0ABP3Y8S5_9BACT
MTAQRSKFGVGFSDSANSLNAGKLAAEAALNQAGLSPEKVQLCFLFCTSRHDPAEFFAGVKFVLGEKTKFFGGFANGTCDNLSLGYDGYETVVGVWGDSTARFDLFVQEGIAFNEYETGKALGAQIVANEYPEGAQMILLFDAVNRLEGKFRMNYGTPFIKGMNETIGQLPNTIGARMLGDMRFKPTYQWYDQTMTQNAAMALVMSGDIQIDYQIMHGCEPVSAYHTVTAVKGATILELDHRPALDVIIGILGEDLAEKPQEVKFFVTLGKNTGDKWERYNPGSYINRMCVGIDQQNRGLHMAEMDLEPGMEIQLMRRSFDMEYVEIRTRKIMQKVKAKKRRIIFGFYINCSGRAAAYSNQTDEDIRYVQAGINGEFPLMGIYEAGELAPIGGALQVLDWSGVLCLFSEPITE